MALQRGRGPGTCCAVWLQCYVELLHPAFTMKVVLSASYLGIISKPLPQILWDFSAQDFPYALFRPVSVYISTGSSSLLPWEHQSQYDHCSSPKLPPCAARSSLPFAARPCGTAEKAAGGLPTPAAMPGKAGLSRLVSGPVTLAPLAAELMEPPKLRELASTSLLSSRRRSEIWAYSQLPGRGGGRGMEWEPHLPPQTAFQEGYLGMGQG